MQQVMTVDEQKAILARGYTRRSFGRFASLLAAGASLPFYNEFALAQSAQRELRETLPPDAVRISGNENPLGPCPEAREAIYNVAGQAGRYDPNGEYAQMIKTAAPVDGLKPAYVVAYAGSADPLHRTICAFVSPTRSLVTADPGYEAPERAAEFLGAKVVRVPLRKDFSHDIKAMVTADPNAGVIYICNPNNPTGTLTSKADIEWVAANKPKGSILLLDEAYIHFSSATPGSELVAADKDVVVLRTFSKAYGMAGLRAGMSFARPDLLEKMAPYASGRVPVTAAAAATASMKVKTLMAERRKINAQIREDTFNFLDQKNFKFVRSESNFFLLDVKQPGKEFAQKMAKEKVFVGRTWPSMPNYSRITVGTQDDMNKFKAALTRVTA